MNRQACARTSAWPSALTLTEAHPHPLLRRIRAAEFGGRCGVCPHRHLCGGSRARAYAASGDPLAEDPGCPYQPQAGSPANVQTQPEHRMLAGGG